MAHPPASPSDKEPDRQRPADSYTRFAGVGLQFAATIGLFAWGGYALDNRLGSSPWMLIIGVFLGFAGAMISLVRRVPVRRGNQQNDSNES